MVILKQYPKPIKVDTEISEHIIDDIRKYNYRYCTEAIVTSESVDFIKLKKELK